MHARQRPRTVCAEIVERVAAREGVGINALPPLHDAIDADALETLAAEDVRLDFDYAGYRVVVDGGVRLRRRFDR